MSNPEPVSDTSVKTAGLMRSQGLARALGIYLPTTVAFRLAGFVRGVLLAHFVSTEQFGLMSLSLLLAAVLTPIGGLGLSEAVVRYVPLYETQGSLVAFLRRAIWLVAGMALVMSGLMALSAPWLGPGLYGTIASVASPTGQTVVVEDAVSMTRWISAVVFSIVAYFSILSVFKGLRMFRAVSAMEFTNAVMFTCTALLGVWLGPATAKTVVIAYALSNIACSVGFMVPLARTLPGLSQQRLPLAQHESVASQMLRFSIWAAVAALLWQTLQCYPLWYLNRVHGPAATGMFGAMRYLAQMVFLAATAVATVVMTVVNKAWESQGAEVADRRFQPMFKATALLLLAASAVLVVARCLVVKMFPGRYSDGQVVMPALLMCFLLASNLTFLTIHFTLIEKTRLLCWPWICGVATNVLLAYGLVRPAGDQALTLAQQLLPSAWASVAAMLVAYAVCVLLLRREGRPGDFGTCVLGASCLALALPWPLMTVVVAALLVLARPLVFTRAEMNELRQSVGRLWAEYVKGGKQT